MPKKSIHINFFTLTDNYQCIIKYLDGIFHINEKIWYSKNVEDWGQEVGGDEGQFRGGWLGRYIAAIGDGGRVN